MVDGEDHVAPSVTGLLEKRRQRLKVVHDAHSVLRRALQFAVEWEVIERNPAGTRFRAAKRKRTVKPGGKKIRFLDPDETRRFLEATKGGAHEALYALALTTGMRPEEVYGLRSRPRSRQPQADGESAYF